MRLAPRTDFAEARALRFEFPGLEIGVAEYDEGPTGCTVFHFPEDASLAIDVRRLARDQRPAPRRDQRDLLRGRIPLRARGIDRRCRGALRDPRLLHEVGGHRARA